MNVTELARILKITPNELHSLLPQLGFDIGAKAIKINNSAANKIIKEWPYLKKKIETQKEAERKKEEIEKKEQITEVKTLLIPKFITIRQLAELANIPVNVVLGELMKNGIFASINEKVDYDTVWLIGEELGFKIAPKEGEEKPEEDGNKKLKNILEKEKKENLKLRPPVIVVMGHVDHGKTSLLDSIRKTNVIEGEAGGITQHIGAYQVTRKNKLLTFIDTPGHEAFTAMRSRGAKIADIAILVVAADDGVKPQTTEAFRIIEAAKIPYIVAINKIDKPEANTDKTKQELSTQLNIIPEDWGGKTPCLPISAKKGIGIDDLLDTLILIADLEEEKLKANPDSSAVGTVIESHVDKGAGPITTLLIQNGTIKIGDQLTTNNQTIGKVRSLKDYKGQLIPSAGPSVPVCIIGLRVAPLVGDIMAVGVGEKIKIKNINRNAQQTDLTNENKADENIPTINLLIKSDVLGSGEAIEESLAKINTKKVKAKIIYKGLGNVTESDIKRAEAAQAQILGFHIKTLPQIEELAREKGVEIKLYPVIYDLINDVKEKMFSLVKPEYKRVDLGNLKVLAVFNTNKDNQIVGGRVLNGFAEPGALISVVRQGEVVADGRLEKLQAGKMDVNRVDQNQECGILYLGKPIIAKEDVLNFYKLEEIK